MILGFIPARGGSKGIQKKNIKSIAGKPLLSWTIEAAKKSDLLDKIVVSSEDKDILEISHKCGADILVRPPELATDNSPIIKTLQHAVSVYPCDLVVLLQPTSPIRDDGLIDFCIQYYNEQSVDSVATGFMCKFKRYTTNTKRRQDINGFFYDNGSVYVINAKLIKKGKLFGKYYGKVYTSKEQNVEIDDEFDFWLAEQILLKRSVSNESA